MRIIKAL